LQIQTIVLPVHHSQDTRLAVFHSYLKGNSREEIASQCLISTGAVTNIVNEWRNNLGSLVVDNLRELALSLKKAQISPVECVRGFRIGKMMQRFGIDEERLENFMTEIYNRCQILEISPEQIGDYLAETVNLSKIVFPSQIPSYVNAKKAEIEQLEKEIEAKKETISNLNNEISMLEENKNTILENNNISIVAINWYRDIKKELIAMGIPFNEIDAFVDCLRQIRNEGYDKRKLVLKFSQLDSFDKTIEDQERIKQKNWNDIELLNKNKKDLEDQIQFIHLKIATNQELETIGMGLEKLKTIYNTVNEIAKTNNISPEEAIKQFFIDLNEYINIVSFKQKAENLRNEIGTLNTEINNKRKTLMSQQHVGEILQNLLRKGILEKDIEDINAILSLGEFEYYDNASNKIVINKQSLISELTHYRNIRLTIQLLEQKQIHLTNNIKEFENQKAILEIYMNYLFLLLSNIKEIQLLLNKINIALENPKLLLVFLFFISISKDNKKDFKKDDDSPN
jgi:hypothetical protein